MLKPDWPLRRPDDLERPFGPNSAAVEACITRARAFSRSELLRLDLRERHDPDLLLAGWDHIRDRLGDERHRTWRFAARQAAWSAVRDAAARFEIDLPADDGYWRVALGTAAGAARVTRLVACALIEPTAFDPEWLEILFDPWRAVIGEPPSAA
jgi:hypothetical protein